MLNHIVSYVLIKFTCVTIIAAGEEDVIIKFSKEFKFGVSSAAYQIEGGWNASDKGKSIWDHVIHEFPDLIADHSNGDVAADSYKHFKRDIEMVANLGVDFYKFSISWPRLLPIGFDYQISQEGQAYYNNIIDGLIDKGIEPVVTLYHWDLPHSLQLRGGWTTPVMADYFKEYADIVFRLYGDRVKTWVTFSSPMTFCRLGYGDVKLAPMMNASGVGEYQCAHNVIRAHAMTWHLYNNKYRKEQKGKVGISLDANYFYPAGNSTADSIASERYQDFQLGWFAQPIFSKSGGYPDHMKVIIDMKSKLQGFQSSRLPEFTETETNYILGSSDFFGVNYRTAMFVKPPDQVLSWHPSYDDDSLTKAFVGKNQPKLLIPTSLRKMLNWIKNNYGDVEMAVFELGFNDDGRIHDDERVDFLRDCMANLAAAIDDGCNVTRLSVWSLMDGMEWSSGYTKKFGLYKVHFDDADRRREPKDSVIFYKNVTKNREFAVHNETLSLSTSCLKTTTEFIILMVALLIISNIFTTSI